MRHVGLGLGQMEERVGVSLLAGGVHTSPGANVMVACRAPGICPGEKNALIRIARPEPAGTQRIAAARQGLLQREIGLGLEQTAESQDRAGNRVARLEDRDDEILDRSVGHIARAL